jgi:hypothetical protein
MVYNYKVLAHFFFMREDSQICDQETCECVDILKMYSSSTQQLGRNSTHEIFSLGVHSILTKQEKVLVQHKADTLPPDRWYKRGS